MVIVTNDIYVYLLDFKQSKAKETVTENDDGSYSIFINSRLNQEQQNNAYTHALSHITRSDFEKNEISADNIESFAHYCKSRNS